jgi:4-aminobutyrate aminotransferase
VAAYPPYLTLAGRLNALVGDGYKSILLTTGAEAVENAVKIARAHTNRPSVVAFRGGFHGRTLLGMTLTGMSVPYQQNFGPFAPSVFHVPYPYPYRGTSMEDALRGLDELFATEVTPDRVAAILIEPVQGDGGFLPAPAVFLHALREITQRHGIVLVLDEIQTGFGRTGTMFGFQSAGIEPDLVTVAKSLGGGLPLSAVIGQAEIMDAPLPGGLGGTYGGNALACAAALGVLDAFEQDGLLQQGRVMGAVLEAGLRRLQQRFPTGTREYRGAVYFVTEDMRLADLVFVAVIGTNQGHEPGWAEMAEDGVPAEVAERVGVGVAGHDGGHLLAHVDGHLGAMAAEAHGVEEAVMFACTGEAVGREIDDATPAIVDAHVAELRECLLQRGFEDLT